MHRWVRTTSIVGAFAASALVGCRSNPHPPATDYKTVGQDPGRDTELAKRLNAEALELMVQGKHDQAERLLKQALVADVTFGPAHNNLGKVYYHQRKMYLAAWEFQYAIKLMPNQPEPRNNLGLVFENVGKLDEAVDWYSEALELEPDNAQLLGNLARARVRRGDEDEQVRELLAKLVLRDNRPEWVEWARQKLSLLGRATPD